MGEKETAELGSLAEGDDERKAGQVRGGINVDGGGNLATPPDGRPSTPEAQEGAIVKSKSNITNN